MRQRFREHPRVAVVVAFVRRCLQRLVELEFVDRSVALASLTFTALIPLGVVVGSAVPGIHRKNFADSIVDRFDLDARTAKIVEQAFAPPPNVQTSLSVLGVLLLIVSALSFTRGLQRVYETAWRLPRRGVRATPAGLVWLVGIIAFLSIFGGLRSAIVDLSRPVASVVVALACSGVVWMFTPWILLSRRVAWRALIPTAALHRGRHDLPVDRRDHLHAALDRQLGGQLRHDRRGDLARLVVRRRRLHPRRVRCGRRRARRGLAGRARRGARGRRSR